MSARSTNATPAPLDECGCCAGIEVAVPASEVNAPGLGALTYRVGRYATFFETMLARLGQVTIEAASADASGVERLRPLAALTTRDPADPAIALIDAWAVLADVLTFYQERIANEGYLPTAVERCSLTELSRLIGYRPRPGVAASVRLAFTVSAGFAGSLPAGTRAQSMPADGSAPQFYETSAAFAARADWNTLAPRMTRPQLVTPPASDRSLGKSGILVTGADVVDAIYLDGIASQVKPGDGLFFVFGSDTSSDMPALQTLRIAADIDVQSAAKRTQVTLGLDVPADRTAQAQVLLYVDKATVLFPGNAIAAQVAEILKIVATNLDSVGKIANDVPLAARQVVEPAMSRVAILRGIALQRGFTRVAAWLAMLIRSLQWIGLGQQSVLLSTVLPGQRLDAEGDGPADQGPVGSLESLGRTAPASPLEGLTLIVDKLEAPPSVQPRNAQRLMRSVATSFGPQADVAPRLLAALHPAAGPKLYKAWSSVGVPGVRLELHAARVKATLFGASWMGPASTSVANPDAVVVTNAEPGISTAWKSLNNGSMPLELPLDGVYDQIKPGSWVAIVRPDWSADDSSDKATTFHIVVSARSGGVSTEQGFAAKVTLLTLAPKWLSNLNGDDLVLALKSAPLLRKTVVYAQSEPMALAEEPVDADVENASIDLAELVEGFEPGRWVIVSGKRTDLPGAAGTTASELAMVAGVRQGVEAPASVPFPLTAPPFVKVWYVSDANAYGDRLVVGQLAEPRDFSTGPGFMAKVPLPSFINQQYADQVQIAPGVFVNAYVPTAAERGARFDGFDGLLVDPATNVPFGSSIPNSAETLFAWRITTQVPHTVLDLARPLAYTYDRGSVTIYGNVADATNGQSTGEVLGDGDATASFASFPLAHSPLTWVSAATPSGVASTLQVRVNELLWGEAASLADAQAGQRVYATRENDAQVSVVDFGNGDHGARPPTGTANIKATYRFGIGAAGNSDAWTISQLATHPLGAQAVTNPLPSTGGADPDRADQIRANAPMAVMALDRLVSVQDYADFSRNFAGIGKAVATKLYAGRPYVHVTVAGADDIPIDPSSDLHANLLQALQIYGDPSLDVVLATRRVRLLVLAANVALQPDATWEDVEARLRGALLAGFAFDARQLGQSAYLSEAIAIAQGVTGVAWLQFTHFDGIGQDVDAATLASLAATLDLQARVAAQLAQPDPGNAGSVLAAELVYLPPDIPAMLTLNLLAA